TESPDQLFDEAWLKLAMTERRGCLVPAVARNSTEPTCDMVVPLAIGPTVLGVVALRGQAARAPYNEDDLEFLIALAYAFAPIFAHVRKEEELQRENERLRAVSGNTDEMLGESAPMRKLRKQIRVAAGTLIPALVLGETGTGKE